MKRPSFQEKTEIKVISHTCTEYIHENGVETEHDLYGWRGRVTGITGLKMVHDKSTGKSQYVAIESPYTPDNYPTVWWVDAVVKSPIDGHEVKMTFSDWPSQIEPVQKKFIDIDYIREDDLVIGKKEDGTDAIRPKNTGAFEPGDIIQITTKIDGANASIAWDETTGKLEVFSRTNLLDSPGALRGFYDYIKTEVEPKADWSLCPDLVIFGEWCVSHTCKYDKSWYNKWRVYDIWSKYLNCYLPQSAVKNICETRGLEYGEELYYGPFISWDHCRSFLNKSAAYGPEQEGIVIKNQSKLDSDNNKAPAYLKIVNERFKESQHSKKEKKPVDPEAEAAKAEAAKLVASIVTEARVRKIILKLVDEGLVPAELQPKDMGTVMKQLPKRCFADCLKEEPETVKQLGEFAGKFIAAETAKQARKIVVGG